MLAEKEDGKEHVINQHKTAKDNKENAMNQQKTVYDSQLSKAKKQRTSYNSAKESNGQQEQAILAQTPQTRQTWQNKACC